MTKSTDRPVGPQQNGNPGRGLGRRRFLTGLALGAGLAPVTAVFRSPVAATPGAAADDLCYAPGGPLLAATNFQLAGYYDVQTADMAYIEGFTHRLVNGDLRVLYYTASGLLQEISLAGVSYGSVIYNTSNQWSVSIGADHKGITYDQELGRLFTVDAVDYTDVNRPVQIRSYVLGSNGAVSGATGPVGLQGVNSKRVYGGVQRIPAALRASLGGEFSAGWGGYTSLVAQGGGASLGLTAYAIPNPLNFGANAQIPTSQYKVLADHGIGSQTSDWYGSGSPANTDRGRRLTIPLNYYDGGLLNGPPNGDPAGQYPPPGPPESGGQWLSPAPDGFGRWVWGDSYWNTGNWVDTASKRGFLAVASLGGGKNWYGMSTTRSEFRQYELHVYDPAHFAQVAAGTRQPWNVQPSSMVELLLPGAGRLNPHPNPPGNTGNDAPPNGNVIGASFDAASGRLLMMVAGVGATTWAYGRLYVFQLVG